MSSSSYNSFEGEYKATNIQQKHSKEKVTSKVSSENKQKETSYTCNEDVYNKSNIDQKKLKEGANLENIQQLKV